MNLSRFALLLAFLAIIAWLPKPGVSDKIGRPGLFQKLNNKEPLAKKKIVFIAGACSHGPGAHEHNAGCTLLASQINKQIGNLVEAVVYQGWPSDSTVLDNAASLVMYMDGAESHLALKHLQHLDALMKKGVGLACIHYAVEVPKDNGGPEFKRWIGGYFETFWSVNPHWLAEYKSLPKHAVTNGVKPFTINDEWYYHMRFMDNMKGVTPILTAVPPASTLTRKDGPRDNNEFVRKEQGSPQHMCWVTERADGGRGFAFTGGHLHKNWSNENFRKLVLNGIVWTAKVAVPKNGVASPALSDADLSVNLDQKPCVRNR
ncbi:MAG: ThuA domain-containing protein [Chitinophagaceae bacterium]